MISRLLALMGTGLLLAASLALGLRAYETVTAAPPPLPQITEPAHDGTEASTAQNGTTPTTRSPRPDIFYTAITDRPLFAPGRRPDLPEPEPEPAPPTPPEPTAPAPQAPPPQATLHGIIDKSGALQALIGLNGAAPDWRAIGFQFEGWTLAEIGPDWAVLRRDTREIRLELFR